MNLEATLALKAYKPGRDDNRICPTCEMYSPPDSRFCTQCGAKIYGKPAIYNPASDQHVQCAACAAMAAPDHQFCRQCGEAIPTSSFTSPQTFGNDPIDLRPYADGGDGSLPSPYAGIPGFSSSGRQPDMDLSPERRRAFLYTEAEDPLVAADREFAAAEEDWSEIADQMRARRYDLTHVQQRAVEDPDAVMPAGSERTLSEEGAAEITELERLEFRAHRRYETARDRRNALLDEHERASQPLRLDDDWPGLGRVDRDRGSTRSLGPGDWNATREFWPEP
jgi:hypothetical protein